MRRALLFVVLALVVAACGGDDADGPTDTVDDSGQAYLDFTAEDVRGGQVTGTDYAGQDLVLWFWAPW